MLSNWDFLHNLSEHNFTKINKTKIIVNSQNIYFTSILNVVLNSKSPLSCLAAFSCFNSPEKSHSL